MFQRAGEKNSNNKYLQFWQQDNHPIELYGYETLKQKLNYLLENPVRQELCTKRGIINIAVQ